MADNTTNNTNDGGVGNLGDAAKKLLSPLQTAGEAIAALVGAGDKLNKSFGLSRARIEEMKTAFVDSAAGVERLGGSLNDVVKTMEDIAAASHRNVIENEDVIAKIYASSKVVGVEAGILVDHFKNVGYETSQIGPNLEKSVEYIQSVGLNASTVVKDVAANMKEMNRYQFEGGVQGLAKMAAQASMLRFDMKETFQFAEKVLTPEGAIETAAGIQRLGVAIGNLGDPFALMNASINDPSGLQNSLIEATKQFTYFDEETKSFKINPQGVLTLRELAKETGTSFENLSKSALAAADLDKRLEQVSGAGLKFENEEDKQYLANIAKMGKGGKYEVTLEDGTTKQLQNLNQEEFDKLIDQQKKAPKDMEEIQRSQLSVSVAAESNIRAIKDKLFLGAASAPDISTNLEGLRNVVLTFSDKAQKMVPETPEVRKGVENTLDKMGELLATASAKGMNSAEFQDAMKNVKETLFTKSADMDDKTFKAIQDLTKETASSLKGDSKIEKIFREAALGKSESFKLPISAKSSKEVESAARPVSLDKVMGTGTTSKNYTDNINQTKQVNSQVNFGGTITIDVKAPPGVSQQEFKTYFESEEFKKKIYEYYNQKAKELEKQK